jgi:hypothetical protein
MFSFGEQVGIGGLFWAARVLVNVRNRLVAGAATAMVPLVILAAFAMQVFEKVGK